MSQSSMPSWLHTFASVCLSGRCCSPGTASCLADSQGLTWYLVYPEELPVQLDHWSIPSYSFHGAHMDITTLVEPVPSKGMGSTKWWRPCMPAMATGLTDHGWTLHEVLTLRVPLWPQPYVG